LGLLGQAWLVGPTAPATVIDGEPVLRMTLTAGERGEARFVLENHQAAACLLRPMVSALAGPGGRRWNATVVVLPRPLLLLSGEEVEAVMVVDVPAELPDGTYRGDLVMLGARDAMFEVVIEVVSGEG
jgi:hypothetical protein